MLILYSRIHVSEPKKEFGETPDETLTDPMEIFRVLVFHCNYRAIVSMNERFQQLKNHHYRFGVVLYFSELS